MTEETLFHEALSKPAAERAAFLDAACVSRPELRAAVEALLGAHESAGSFLDRPPSELEVTVDSQPGEATGEFAPSSPDATVARPTHPDSTGFRGHAEAIAVIAGRYTLEEKIGEGGMGEVWVARQTEPVKRHVALKLIKPGMDSRAVLARFDQERQALALMDHPNIAKVLDGGMTPTGQPFFVMELVDGLPLTRFCDDNKLNPKERLELFIPICQAVQHAHQKGIVHRDLKPANILVTLVDGKLVPKVIDFGVAKAIGGKLTDESLSTQFGAVIGTLEYMSPEQAGLSDIDIDTRADIYSLGVILYELMTGLRPIDATRLKQAAISEMIRIIREEEPSKPSTRLSTDESLPSVAAVRQTEPRKLMSLLRGELDWVVMKCLEKQRDLRYETASDLARDIQRYLANEPVEARPPSFGYRAGKFLRRHKGPVIAASLVLLALVAGILGTTREYYRAEKARQAEAEQRSIAQTNEAEAIRAALSEAEQRRQVAAALVASRRLSARYAFERAHRFAENNQIDLGMLWFGRALEQAPVGADDLEHAVRTAMALWSLHINLIEIRMTEYVTNSASATALSGDGRIGFLEEFSQTFSVFDLKSGRSLIDHKKLKRTDPSQAMVGRIQAALNHDGTTLAIIDDRAVQLWDTTTGRERSAPLMHDGPVTSASFHPGGKLLVTASGDKLRLWEVTSGRALADLSPEKEAIRQVAFSPDGRILLARGENTIWLRDPVTQREITRLVNQPDVFSFAQFSADGKTIWTGFPGRLLKRWDSATGNPIGVVVKVQHPPEWDGRVTIHPGGRFYAIPYVAAPYWDTATGQPLPNPFSRLADFAREGQFSPDGRLLWAGGTTWDVAPGTVPLRVLEHPGTVEFLRLSPDGSLVATVVPDMDHWVIRLLRATTGQTIGEPIVVPANQRGQYIDIYELTQPVAFGPDGKVAVTTVRDNAAQLWDTETGQPRGARLQHQKLIRSVAFSPDGTKVATASSDCTARLWDASTGAPIGPSMEHEREVLLGSTGRRRPNSIRGVAFSPDGRKLLTWGAPPGTPGGWCRLWDVATSRPAGPVLLHQGEVMDAAFSPDSTMFLTGSFRPRLWQTATCQEIDRGFPFTDLLARVAFNPNGKTILVVQGVERYARLFDVASGLPIGGPLRDDDVRDAAFSPDGKLVVTSTQNGRIRLWDAAIALPIGPALAGGPALCFAPDGRSLFTGAKDGLDQWKVPTPLEGSRDQLIVWTQVVTSSELDPSGTPGMLMGEEIPGGVGMHKDGWPDRNRKLIDLGGPPKNLDRTGR